MWGECTGHDFFDPLLNIGTALRSFIFCLSPSRGSGSIHSAEFTYESVVHLG
jgi:hypothetical protein